MTRLSGGEALRTSSITGSIEILGPNMESRLPEVGEVPIVSNDTPLENPEASGRVVNTSPIASYIDTPEGREVVTQSGSKYLFKQEE